MTSYKIKGGAILTDSDIETLAEQAEQGSYPGTPGDWIVRPKGRPALANEPLVTLTVKVTPSMRAALDNKAAESGETRSQFLRSILEKAIA
mgnify:CR=1 FL=1